MPSRRGLCGPAILLGVLVFGVLGGSQCAFAQSTSSDRDRDKGRPDSTSLRAGEATRAGQWRQMRRAKAQNMQPPKSGFLDRVGRMVRTGGSIVPHRLIFEIPQLDVAGFHPVLGGLGDDTGGTAGVLYEPPVFDGGNRLARFEVLGSWRRYYGTELLLGLESEAYVGHLYARYQHRPGNRFYGIGPENKRANESVYRLDEGIVGGLFGRSATDGVLLGGHVSYRVDRYGAGQGNAPRVKDRFGDDLPGVGADVNSLLVGVFVELDLRDTSYRRAFGHRFAPTENRLRSVSLDATQGFYLSTEVTHNVDTRLHEFDFTRYTLDVREFIPVDEELMHGFAFRQFASFTQTVDGGVPFYRLQTIGGSRTLRGYSNNRFGGRNVLLANAEVRCQIWHWLDMALFVDTGHAFRNVGDVELNDPYLGYGIGFRIQKNDQTLGRLDFARSEEGFSAHLDLGSLF